MIGKITYRLRALERDADYAANFPSLFWLETTSACNLRCPSCPRTYSKRPRVHMEESIFRKVIQEISFERPDIENLGLHFFGEALLNPRFFDFLEIAKTYLPNTNLLVSSNANLLSPEKVNDLLNSRLNLLSIWPDTTNPELYHKVRTGGDLNSVEQAIIELLEKRRELGREDIRIVVGAILYKNNMADFKEFVTKWEIIFSKYKNVHVSAMESHDWAGQVPADNVINSVKNSKLHVKKVCFMPFKWCIVSSEGYLTPCCFDCDLRLAWGNVKANSIREIWNGPEARDQRERQLTGQITRSALCYTCHMYRQPISSAVRYLPISKIPGLQRIIKKEYYAYINSSDLFIN